MDLQRDAIRIADTRHELDLAGKRALLQTFALHNEYPQLIHLRTGEFSAVCPGSGLPDIGTLDIWYVPKQQCIELKSLKFYLFSFRDDAIFQEPVADVMFGHLLDALQPQYLKLSLLYNTRGGIDTAVALEYGDPASARTGQSRLV